MLLQSIFHVSHLRGLFPSDLFKSVDMPNLGGTCCPFCDHTADTCCLQYHVNQCSQAALTERLCDAAGLQIMMLKPDTPESRLLVDWVEGGKSVLVFFCMLALYGNLS